MKKIAILNDTRGYHLGCEFVNHNLVTLCEKHNMKPVGTFAINKPRRLKIPGVDAIIINGEGTFHHSNGYQLDKAISICEGKKTFLINTVYDSPESKKKPNFELISCRESISAKECNADLVVPDLSLYHMPKVKPGKPMRIGYTSGVTPENRGILGHLPNHRPIRGTEGYLEWLNSLDLFVTGRFHGICMAAYYGIPFLAFKSNSHKNEGILKDMGCSELLIEEEKQIAHKMRDARCLISKAHKYAMDAKEKQEKLFERIYRAI
jgi:hypothetical protein